MNASDLAVAGEPYRAVLRETPLSIEVRVYEGTVSVVWNGNTIYDKVTPPWSVPEVGYVGFTASTGVNTDQHHVMSVTLACLP